MKNSEGIIEANALLGHNYALRKDYEKSLFYYNESLKIADKLGKKTIKVPSLIGKGNVLYYKDNLSEASILFEEAIAITEKFNSGDHSTKAGLYNNTGNIYLTQADYNKAIENYKKGFQLYFELNDKFNMSLLSFNIGDAYLGLNQYDSSLKFCNINLFLAKELNNIEEVKYAYKGLTNLYEQKGEYDSAYKYFQLYIKYRDSLIDKEYNIKVDELVNQYQDEKQLKDLDVANEKVRQATIIQEQSQSIIRLLIFGAIVLFLILTVFFLLYRRSQKANLLIREQSKLISQKNQSIDKALFQKDILLKEVHHRVKNNLQIIASLLNLQTMKIENEVAKKAIEDSKSRVQAIALMHKSLYQDEHLNKVDLKSYINDLITNQSALSISEKNAVNFITDVEELMVSIDDAVPLGLIVSELISNTIKHAFDDTITNPEVNILLGKTESKIRLRYSDNGRGVQADFDIYKIESLGFEIITALTDQIQGEISIITHKPFSIEIRF